MALFSVSLIAQPDKGDLIQGTGGLRKVRIGLGRQGKRGGGRVIYFLASAEIIYLILAYPKNVKDNLTATEPAALKALTSRLKEEAPSPITTPGLPAPPAAAPQMASLRSQ